MQRHILLTHFIDIAPFKPSTKVHSHKDTHKINKKAPYETHVISFIKLSINYLFVKNTLD